MNNLRHAREHEPRNGEWLPLGLTVAEGLYKTDVLLYASICEAALYSVLRLVYLNDRNGAHQAVKDCFCRIEDRVHIISGHQTSITLPASTVSGELCLRSNRGMPVCDSEIKFASLIKAGEAIDIYNASLTRRLDTLREDRNTIHLGKEIERSNQLRAFKATDRTRVKNTTEELRVALRRFVRRQPRGPSP